MRICILTKAEPYAWTRHYVQAFRETGADVLTIGPTMSVADLAGMHLGHLADRVVPNDVDAVLDNGFPLIQVLPDGWRPDLIVAVSIGGEALCPSFEGLRCPRAYISVDTWQSPRDYLDALHYDYVFAAQREAVSRLQAFGARKVTWLPLGCNPAEHYPVSGAKQADISFVGSIALPIHQERYDLLQRLQAEFTVIGRSGLYGEGFCQACCAGRLTFNHSAVFDVNMRVFEALAMGCPLLTNREPARNGLFELFEDGKHLIAFDTADELMERVRYYLANDEARQAIGRAGRHLALSRHTYLHRVQTIIETVFERVPSPDAGLSADPTLKYFPQEPGRVLDVGMSLEEVVGVVFSMGATDVWGVGERGKGGYTGVVAADRISNVPHCIDTAVIRGVPPSYVYDRLASGGVVIVRLTPEDAAREGIVIEGNALNAWLTGLGYNMQTGTTVVSPGGELQECILAGRKRTRRLGDLVNETFEPLPVGCHFVKEWIHNWIATLPAGI